MNDHLIFSGQLLTLPDKPGVTFVWPTYPEDAGFPQNKRGYSIPFVVVTELVTSFELMSAAVHVGHALGLTATLRRAVKAWLRSDEAQKLPVCLEGESRDDAVRRVRQMGAEADERRREKAEREREARVSDEDRAWTATKVEILDRHMALAWQEIEELKAAQPQT